MNPMFPSSALAAQLLAEKCPSGYGAVIENGLFMAVCNGAEIYQYKDSPIKVVCLINRQGERFFKQGDGFVLEVK